jgi:hypothetical protein
LTPFHALAAPALSLPSRRKAYERRGTTVLEGGVCSLEEGGQADVLGDEELCRTHVSTGRRVRASNSCPGPERGAVVNETMLSVCVAGCCIVESAGGGEEA